MTTQKKWAAVLLFLTYETAYAMQGVEFIRINRHASLLDREILARYKVENNLCEEDIVRIPVTDFNRINEELAAEEDARREIAAKSQN